jgi:hypothetical protein
MNATPVGKGNMKQYIRDRQRNKVGVMLAFLDGNEVMVGWSVVCKHDTFDNVKGEKIAASKALGRAETTIPRKWDEQISFFCNRVTRYFKEENLILPIWVVVMSQIWEEEYSEDFYTGREIHKIANEVAEIASKLFADKLKAIGIEL